MHNTLTRTQNVFGFFTTVASVVAAAIAIISLLTLSVPPAKDGSLQLRNVQVVKGRPHYYTVKKEEYAHIKFDLDIDLSSLFTWNTKQVFLYVTASYPPSPNDPSSLPSKAIVWDAILPHPLAPDHHNHYVYPTDKPSSSPSSKSKSKTKKSKKSSKPNSPSSPKKRAPPGIIALSSQRPKYQITDPSGRLAERANATLELNWNVQPWVGALVWGSGNLPAQRFFGDGTPWSAWRRIPGAGARTEPFDLPPLRDRKEAQEQAGGLNTEKGAEGYKLHVG